MNKISVVVWEIVIWTGIIVLSPFILIAVLVPAAVGFDEFPKPPVGGVG